MRLKFQEYVSNIDDSLDDAAIDTYLNRAYQYYIPSEVGGEFNEQLWTIAAVTGTAEYAYPDTLVGPNQGQAYIKSYRSGGSTVEIGLYYLRYETDPAAFERWFTGSTTGRPTRVLLYERKATLRPVPDRDYDVVIPSRGGPTAGLTTAGIVNEVHAQAVLRAAAAEYLAEVEDEMGEARERRQLETALDRLRVYSQARPNQRLRGRSF